MLKPGDIIRLTKDYGVGDIRASSHPYTLYPHYSSYRAKSDELAMILYEVLNSNYKGIYIIAYDNGIGWIYTKDFKDNLEF